MDANVLLDKILRLPVHTESWHSYVELDDVITIIQTELKNDEVKLTTAIERTNVFFSG